MNDTFDAARLHREELDREIDSIMTERQIRSAASGRPGLPTRARTGLGRRLISLGTTLVGPAAAGPRDASLVR
jgi:hypothetical protein